MSEDAKDGLVAVSIVVIGLLAVAVIGLVREQMWTDGYCAALGGERITRYACEVDGKVIRV